MIQNSPYFLVFFWNWYRMVQNDTKLSHMVKIGDFKQLNFQVKSTLELFSALVAVLSCFLNPGCKKASGPRLRGRGPARQSGLGVWSLGGPWSLGRCNIPPFQGTSEKDGGGIVDHPGRQILDCGLSYTGSDFISNIKKCTCATFSY